MVKVLELVNKFQSTVLGGMEEGFYRYGKLVSKYPAVAIIFCLVLTGLCSTGFIFWKEESDGLKLWQPQESEYTKQTIWLKENFPPDTRFCSILILADNVLQPSVLQQFFLLYEDILKIPYNDTLTTSFWKTICRKIPGPGGNCMEFSPLQVFKEADGSYNKENINSLTLSQIQDKINTGWGKTESLFGSVSKTADGVVESAKAMTARFIIYSKDREDESKDFELKLINMVNERQFKDGVKAYPLTPRSFGDLVGGSISGDLQMLAAGYLLIFIFVCFNLGRRNSVEHRVLLSIIGIFACGMGIGASYGLSQLLGFFFTGLHGILPFLMLGVGIDDMFVIMQAWENLEEEERLNSFQERFGATMRHAGVAVTITSITDFLAFLTGATTVIPALASFCVYSAFGILFIYYFQVTFFLAWFSLDQRRVEDVRDGIICCWKKKDWEPSQCSQFDILGCMFTKLVVVLDTIPGKVVVILLTALLFGLGLYGTITLETDFDYSDWLEDGTYLKTYLAENTKHFPANGDTAGVYTTALDYGKDLKNLNAMINDLRSLEGNNLQTNSIDSWVQPFIDSTNTQNNLSGADLLPDNPNYSEANFTKHIGEFLNGPGKMYSSNFEYNKENPSKVSLTKIKYTHILFDKTAKKLDAMNQVFDVVRKYSFTNKVFAYGESYANNLTIEIITAELIRNILISLCVIFLCSLFLIADIFAALLVLVVVTITVVNVAGYCNFWGLTVDTTFAIFVTISIGLCVDYSAHVAHGFMTETGTRGERMKNTMIKIGPAVLNGGISTFIAFVLLAGSSSKVFFTFFQIFFLVVWFGLFHGLIFLPVLLSLIGPASHRTEEGLGHKNMDSSWEANEKENKGFEKDPPLAIISRTPTPTEVNNTPTLPGEIQG